MENKYNELLALKEELEAVSKQFVDYDCELQQTYSEFMRKKDIESASKNIPAPLLIFEEDLQAVAFKKNSLKSYACYDIARNNVYDLAGNYRTALLDNSGLVTDELLDVQYIRPELLIEIIEPFESEEFHSDIYLRAMNELDKFCQEVDDYFTRTKTNSKIQKSDGFEDLYAKKQMVRSFSLS